MLCGGLKCSLKHQQVKRKRNNEDSGIVCSMYGVPTHSLLQETVIKLYGAYYGELNVPCMDLGNGNVRLSATSKGLSGQPDVYIQSIDCQANKLDVNKYFYTYDYLLKLPVIERNIEQLKKNHDAIVLFKSRLILTKEEQQTYNTMLVYNNAVDVHFGTYHYSKFLHKRLKVNNIIPTNLLLSIVNVPKVDNAFFTGRYMVFGNGDTLFQPMGTLDIIGHELGHGIVQSYAGLIYEGHSGALNESWADILGCAYERYCYNQFNTNTDKTDDLEGSFDWLMGEDNARLLKYLRNMKDPRECQMPQPIEYKGQYWGNPNETKSDNGFVHKNSGPWNHSFYDFSQKITIMKALDIYMAALKLLKTDASYMDARDALKKVCPPEHLVALQATLNKVGLTDTAVSDWKKTK